jgi:hypothetical protein
MSTINGPGTESTPSSTGSGTETLKRDARAVADEATNVAEEIKSEASAQVEQLTEEAKEQLSQATDKVRGLASEQKDLLAAQIGDVASAMERVASDLEANNGASAQYARMIADRAGKLSSSIRDNSVDQLLDMAQDFGRRQPAAFLGAAALLGFAASRFLTASANRSAAQPLNEGIDTGDGGRRPPAQPDLYMTDTDGGRL